MNIKTFCRCSLFPSCRAKDLSAPLYDWLECWSGIRCTRMHRMEYIKI